MAGARRGYGVQRGQLAESFERRRTRVADNMNGPGKDIAVIGMACIFPQAPNLGTFWENIVGKVDAIGDAPSDWGGDLVFDPDTQANDRIYTKRGGFIADLSRFDPLEYGVMPKEVEGGEPEHFIALRVAHEALN